MSGRSVHSLPFGGHQCQQAEANPALGNAGSEQLWVKPRARSPRRNPCLWGNGCPRSAASRQRKVPPAQGWLFSERLIQGLFDSLDLN